MRLPFFDKKTAPPAARALATYRALDNQTLATDGWFDAERKIGTNNIAREQAGLLGFYASRYDYSTLSQLVDFDWLARRIVRAIVEAAWQESLVFAKPEDRDNWDRINYIEGNDDGAFLTAAIWARTHGASLLIMGVPYTKETHTPLPEEHGPIEWLEPVSAEDYDVTPEDLNKDESDPLHFGKPEFYRITGDHRFRGKRFHRSRVILFAGPTASSRDTAREPDKLVGLSALDPVIETVRSFGLTWESTSEMMKQASIPIWHLHGLIAGLASDSADVRARFELNQEMMSVNRAVLLDADKDEQYKREAVDFANVPQILQQQALRVAAAGQIPVQELFGRIVSGLGDTGAEEAKKWNRQVNSYRTRSLAPRIRQILGPDVDWEFPELADQEPKDFVSVVKEWWQMGMITDAELRQLTADALTLPDLTPEQQAELFAKNTPIPEEDPDDGDTEEDPEEASSKDDPAQADPDEAS